MREYASLGPFRKEDTDKFRRGYISKIAAGHPDDGVYLEGEEIPDEEMLEAIGVNSLFLSGIETIESVSCHVGGEAVSITYKPSRLAVLQRIEPMHGYFMGEAEVVDYLEKKMKKLAQERNCSLSATKKFLDERELIRFCEEFFPHSIVGRDHHIHNILTFFDIPCKELDSQSFKNVKNKTD